MGQLLLWLLWSAWLGMRGGSSNDVIMQTIGSSNLSHWTGDIKNKKKYPFGQNRPINIHILSFGNCQFYGSHPPLGYFI